MKDIDRQIEILEKEIEDLKSRFPAHSIKPPMIIELEELEDRLEDLINQKKETEK